jgi:hypothetical protein
MALPIMIEAPVIADFGPGSQSGVTTLRIADWTRNSDAQCTGADAQGKRKTLPLTDPPVSDYHSHHDGKAILRLADEGRHG